MRTTSVALLGFIAILVSAPASQAAQTNAETCRAAIREKLPCKGTHPNQPARANCVKAAMERCKANGPSAI